MALTMTPRQPFAPLDPPRMRSILRSNMNLKNQRDGLLSKRQPLSVTDAENIDPSTRLTKRKRAYDEDGENDPKAMAVAQGPSKPVKASRMALTTVDANTTTKAPVPLKASSLTSPSKTSKSPSKPTTRTPLGRSPQPSRRSIAKPSSGPASRRSVKRPFSITTALSGGKPQAKAKAQAQPASWAFDIHVDSEQEEMTNLMQHSTGVLDLSDDERPSHASPRGKENIPPAELDIVLAPAAPSASSPATTRKSPAKDDDVPRSPLGELSAVDYYPDGCHAFSYAVVYEDADADADADADEENRPAEVKKMKAARHVRAPSKLSIAEILEATAPKESVKDAAAAPTEIDIWESGSAAEENAD
ncbi:hypothetical protein BDV59DRAFT_164306 [Aspergillus ambiguus]|uniref:uncharacterized protein n=1 Tax=Aspergillus ambiguus TaxID=176160 RepID=UPI003CCE34AE